MHTWALVVFAILGAPTNAIKVKVAPAKCDALVAAEAKALQGEHDKEKAALQDKIEELKRRHQQEIAILEEQNEELRKGFKLNLAQCASSHLGHRDPDKGLIDESGTVRIYLDQASVCGDHGILQFRVAPLLKNPTYKLNQVQVMPPSGMSVETAILHTQWTDGVVVVGAVFDVAQIEDAAFGFRFVGNSGEVITAHDVLFPVVGS